MNNRMIIEDTYESFIKNMHSILKWSGVHKGHVVRFSKEDGVNYKRLMDVTNLFSEVVRSRSDASTIYESYYIFLEKHYESMASVTLLNVRNDTYFKRRLLDTVLSARIRSMYLEGPPVETATYERFTSPHRILSETDVLFDNNSVIKTTIISNDDLQRTEKDIQSMLSVDQYEKFQKLANQYREDYLMSKVAFSESLDIDNLDLKNNIMDQQEEFVRTLFKNDNKNIKSIYKQKFDADTRIWIIDRLESLYNI